MTTDRVAAAKVMTSYVALGIVNIVFHSIDYASNQKIELCFIEESEEIFLWNVKRIG